MPEKKDDEGEYVVPKPFPGWMLRVVGVVMMMPLVVVLALKLTEGHTELTVGSAIFAIAGMYLLAGKIPDAPGF